MIAKRKIAFWRHRFDFFGGRGGEAKNWTRLIYSAFLGLRIEVKCNGYSIGDCLCHNLLHGNVCSLCARKNIRCLVTESNSKAFSDYIVYTEGKNTKPMTAVFGAELISAA